MNENHDVAATEIITESFFLGSHNDNLHTFPLNLSLHMFVYKQRGFVVFGWYRSLITAGRHGNHLQEINLYVNHKYLYVFYDPNLFINENLYTLSF